MGQQSGSGRAFLETFTSRFTGRAKRLRSSARRPLALAVGVVGLSFGLSERLAAAPRPSPSPLGVSAAGQAPAPARELAPEPPSQPPLELPGAPRDTLRDTRFEWQLVMGKHWQITSPPGEETSVTDAREGTRGACGAGMVEVKGRMKQHWLLDELQLQACTKWIDRKWPERCAEYDRDRWLALSRDLPTKDVHVCMDRFEYPNKKGEYPVIMVSWYEARDACGAQGKRLCTEDEWTFACEGEEASPYPNGYARDRDACLNDQAWKKFDGVALSPRTGKAAQLELDRLWQGLPSGARPLCRSGAGVYDMTGNVDEWTRSSIAGERPSVLKGGYWGPVRTRCRPATKAHDEGHTFYQQGFRCCADAP